MNITSIQEVNRMIHKIKQFEAQTIQLVEQMKETYKEMLTKVERIKELEPVWELPRISKRSEDFIMYDVYYREVIKWLEDESTKKLNYCSLSGKRKNDRLYVYQRGYKNLPSMFVYLKKQRQDYYHPNDNFFEDVLKELFSHSTKDTLHTLVCRTVNTAFDKKYVPEVLDEYHESYDFVELSQKELMHILMYSLEQEIPEATKKYIQLYERTYTSVMTFAHLFNTVIADKINEILDEELHILQELKTKDENKKVVQLLVTKEIVF